MSTNEENLNIGVIGGGVAGIIAAYLLQRKHRVTLLEKNSYIGGHTNTIVLDSGPDEGLAVDTGFIVFNDRNYTNLIKFFQQLDITGQPSDMSFGFCSRSRNFEYSSDIPHGLFAQKRNIVRPAFYSMIRDMLRFNRTVKQDIATNNFKEQTLGEYLKAGKYGLAFLNYYLIPTGAAIWSMPPDDMFQYPAESFLRFYYNHGLLDLKGRPQWMTVPGGSHTYVRKMLQSFSGEFHCNKAITEVERLPNKVKVQCSDGTGFEFDMVVIAAHADEAFAMLKDPCPDEKRLLGIWRYSRNYTVLHTDTSVMPKSKNAWASWSYSWEPPRKNFTAQPYLDDIFAGTPVSLTYYMNRLQGLQAKQQYFVTLNRDIPEQHIIKEIDYSHPTYTFESVKAQQELGNLNGKNRTFYCGSYFGYGFHEDAVKSSVAVAKHFGIEL